MVAGAITAFILYLFAAVININNQFRVKRIKETYKVIILVKEPISRDTIDRIIKLYQYEELNVLRKRYSQSEVGRELNKVLYAQDAYEILKVLALLSLIIVPVISLMLD